MKRVGIGKTKSWKNKVQTLKAETYALYLAYKHPDTPRYAKVFAGLVVAYAFSPIDLIPDFIPIIGYLDDLILVPLGIWLSHRMIPVEVIEDCRRQAREVLEEERPANWYIAVIIITIWVFLAGFSIYLLFKIFK